MNGRASPYDVHASELRGASLIIDDWLNEIRRLGPAAPAVMAFTGKAFPAPAPAAPAAGPAPERQRSRGTTAPAIGARHIETLRLMLADTETLPDEAAALRAVLAVITPPIAVGDRVCYHSIIGGPVTSMGHTVVAIDRAPNPFGCDVAWITGKAACVALDALSRPQQDAAVTMRRYERMAEDLINWIVEQRLFQAYCAVDREHGVLVVWCEAAVEQLAARLAGE